jgi:hypothetical protein
MEGVESGRRGTWGLGPSCGGCERRATWELGMGGLVRDDHPWAGLGKKAERAWGGRKKARPSPMNSAISDLIKNFNGIEFEMVQKIPS